MTEHTPTPWRLQDGRVQGPAKYNIGGYVDIARCEQFFHERDHLRSIAPNHEECAANAAFIVKAVNLHDALVKALEDIVNPIEALRRYAKENDRDLDGHLAVQLAKNPDHLKSIAREALKSCDVGNPRGASK